MNNPLIDINVELICERNGAIKSYIIKSSQVKQKVAEARRKGWKCQAYQVGYYQGKKE